VGYPAKHRHGKERSVVAASVYLHARSRRFETGWFLVEGLKEYIRTEIRRIDIAELTICSSVHKSTLSYKEIISSTFSNQ